MRALDVTAERIRNMLASREVTKIRLKVLEQLRGCWKNIDSRSGKTKPGPRRLNALNNPDLAEEKAAELAEEFMRAGATKRDIAVRLNTRGMRLYKRGDFQRAAIAFEWASDLDWAYPPAAYNRAAMAGRRGDALESVYWLWRLRFMRVHKYCPGSEETYARAAKARTDTDFNPIRP